jgi:ubiquinone/menaquinone biosynthesis C-methylase UbiE
MRILDAGAGNGRNAIYLARRGCTVTALDFSGSALTEARRRIDEAGMAQRVSLVAHSLTDPLPFTDASFDFSLDAYVFCHFLEEDARLGFWRNMARVTKRGGHLLSIVFSTEDEYYSRLLRTSPGHGLVCDPVNGIWKRLYTETEIRDFFASKFELSYFAKFEFSDAVLGDKYRRVVLISVLRNQAA